MTHALFAAPLVVEDVRVTPPDPDFCSGVALLVRDADGEFYALFFWLPTLLVAVYVGVLQARGVAYSRERETTDIYVPSERQQLEALTQVREFIAPASDNVHLDKVPVHTRFNLGRTRPTNFHTPTIPARTGGPEEEGP